MPQFSEDDLRGLSAAERETLRELDDDDEDIDALKQADSPATLANEGEDDGDSAKEASKAVAQNAPDAGTAASNAEPGTSGGTAGANEKDADPDLELARVTPNDIDVQRKVLRNERNDALQKMLDGEITRDEFQAIDERVSGGLDELVRAEAADAARQQIRADSMMTEFNKEVRSSRAELKAAGLDPAALSGEFDRALRMFAKEAHERGLEDRPGELLASKDALAETVAYMLRRHGKAGATASAAPAPVQASATPAAAPAPKRNTSPVDRSTLPPTLAGVPVAADASISSEFAHLAGLEGADLERAVTRMTPEQHERWVAEN